MRKPPNILHTSEKQSPYIESQIHSWPSNDNLPKDNRNNKAELGLFFYVWIEMLPIIDHISWVWLRVRGPNLKLAPGFTVV